MKFLCLLFGHDWGRPLMWPIHRDGDCDSGGICIHMAQQCQRCGFHRMAP